jgi:hypothetical protein
MARATLSKVANAIVLGAALSMPGGAQSAPFPTPLLGKSVTVDWTSNRQQIFEGSDEIVSRSFSSSLRIYVSTAGRPFTKEAIVVTGAGGRGSRNPFGRGGGRTAESIQAPDDIRSSTGANRIVHFESGALLVDNPLMAGARRVSITFDAAYTSCKARVTWGRESGTGPIRQRSWINGRRFETVSIQTSTPTCSVTSGNVFGAQ